MARPTTNAVIGPHHVGVSVPDLDADLRAKGVDIVWDVAEHGGMKAAFVRDNTGNLVELMEDLVR